MLFAIGILGLLVGSFINAAVWRQHERSKGRKLSVWRGRSMCPHCQHQLSALDLVPVLSYLALNGKCRYCKKPISIQYPIVELLTGVLFALSYSALDSGLVTRDLIIWLYFLAVLIFLSLYDIKWMLLPDRVLLPATIVAILNQAYQFALNPVITTLYPLFGGIVVGAVFYGLAAISGGRWMGGGDIKLVFFMGLVLGPANLAVALMLGFNTAAATGLGLIATGVKKRTDHIPFGPFLAGGTTVAMLYGQQLIDWYAQIIGL